MAWPSGRLPSQAAVRFYCRMPVSSMMVTVDGVAEFVRALSDALGEQIEVPPMHITTRDSSGFGGKLQRDV